MHPWFRELVCRKSSPCHNSPLNCKHRCSKEVLNCKLQQSPVGTTWPAPQYSNMHLLREHAVRKRNVSDVLKTLPSAMEWTLLFVERMYNYLVIFSHTHAILNCPIHNVRVVCVGTMDHSQCLQLYCMCCTNRIANINIFNSALKSVLGKKMLKCIQTRI